MKHLSAYKSLLALFTFLLLTGLCSAQTQWTQKSADILCDSYAMGTGKKLKRHEHFDAIAFARQYGENKAAWDKAAAFLRDRNLADMAPGKYPIDGDNVYAIITESKGNELDSSKWEAHKIYADLHYVIKGREKIGVVTRDIVKVTSQYDEVKDLENYYTNGKFYTATPGSFTIFLPGEVHQANIGTGGGTIKKMVIKVKTVH